MMYVGKTWGDSGFPDRILWLKAVAKRYAWLDLSRVGIFGGSAGGQSSTRALLAHGDFYQVGVSDCGCHDNRMDKLWWNELWMGRPLGDHYAEQSNVTNTHRLTGKLLLIVGELDHNVDPASTMQVVNALIKSDRDFEMLVVPGGGHGIAESKYGTHHRGATSSSGTCWVSSLAASRLNVELPMSNAERCWKFDIRSSKPAGQDRWRVAAGWKGGWLGSTGTQTQLGSASPQKTWSPTKLEARRPEPR